jgi:dTDP-4-amino-4,6-dideoxygalactose transaminase
LGRDELMQRLLDKGIATRRGIMLAHQEKPYFDTVPEGQLTRSEQASANSLLLPVFPQMTEQQQDQVLDALDELTASRTASKA